MTPFFARNHYEMLQVGRNSRGANARLSGLQKSIILTWPNSALRRRRLFIVSESLTKCSQILKTKSMTKGCEGVGPREASRLHRLDLIRVLAAPPRAKTLRIIPLWTWKLLSRLNSHVSSLVANRPFT